MAVSKRLRYEIFRRDGHACRYCGAKAPDVELTVDHVVPAALGGGDEPGNLVTACADCNAGKTSSSPDAPIVEGVAGDALRWAAAMRKAAEIQATDTDARLAYATAFYDAWSPIYSLPYDWRSTIDRWYEMGIELDTVLDCLDTALGARGVSWRWKYFCGIVWRRINRQQIARDILANEERDG